MRQARPFGQGNLKLLSRLTAKGRTLFIWLCSTLMFESLILLSVKASVNSKVKNPTHNTPLHIAVKNESQILVRHLLLAGAQVSDVDNHERSALHMAVEGDFHSIVYVLLENKADLDQAEDDGNNALHTAMQLGALPLCKVLIEDSNVNLMATNARGENCLHQLASHPKGNVAEIFQMLKNVLPTFPFNKQITNIF